MNPRRLIVITTRLPPAICGIGTYSWLLNRHWPNGGSATRFFVIDGAAQSTPEMADGDIAEFGGRPERLSQMLEAAGQADVILHYAGRAYHRYGCPTWLPRVLSKWKSHHRAARLLVFFHELPSNSFAITSKFFWIDYCNGRIVQKLSRIADVIVTNTSEHLRKLEQLSGGADAQLVPVGSNIEPVENSSVQRQKGEFVVFGLPFGRWQTLQLFDREIHQWQESGHLTKLHLVGPADVKFDGRSEQLIAAWPFPARAQRHGALPANEVSQVLFQATFGLTNASAVNWGKSTTFMSYAAHGCAIVARAESDSPPLSFAVAADEVPAILDGELRKRAQALQEWYYAKADWRVSASRISGLLSGSGLSEESR